MIDIIESIYICKYGGYHHKPCKIDGNDDKVPADNNLWIYTAYAKAFGLPVNKELLIKTYSDSLYEKSILDVHMAHAYKWYITRYPGKVYPPISRDELIGINFLLGYYALTDVINDDFTWYNKDKIEEPDFKTTIRAIKDLIKWRLQKKHRNYAWQNKKYYTYHLLSKFGPHDVYYLKKSNNMHGIEDFFRMIMFNLYCAFTVIFTRKFYVKNVLWLQLYHLNSKFWIRFINYKKNMKKEFPEDHPIVEVLNEFHK